MKKDRSGLRETVEAGADFMSKVSDFLNHETLTFVVIMFFKSSCLPRSVPTIRRGPGDWRSRR